MVQQSARIVRDELAALLAEAGFRVVASVATHDELIEHVGRSNPDVVIAEIDPDDDLGALLRQVQSQDRSPRVVALHGDLLPGSGETARAAGVTLVPLHSGVDALLDALRTPATGADATRAQPPDAPDEGVIEPLLTHRELQVLAGVSGGFTTREISAALGISPKTVENHKQRIFAKLGVQNQAHAVAVAVRGGLLRPAHNLPGRTGRAS